MTLGPPPAAAKPVLYRTLEVVRLAAATDHRAVVVSPGIASPRWSRDGASLFFRREGRYGRVPAAGGKPEVVDAGLAMRETRNPSLSPDGKTRVYSQDHNIYTAPAAGGKRTRLTAGKGVNLNPEFSPDGAAIYFQSDRSGTSQIWRMRPDGSQAEPVTSDEFQNAGPRVSPDGRSLVFFSSSGPIAAVPQDLTIRILSLSDQRIHVLTRITGAPDDPPAWSPDGRQLAVRQLPADPVTPPVAAALRPRPALRLRSRRSRREAVADHGLGQLRPVRRPAGRRVDHLGRLAEILRTDRGGCDDTQRLCVFAAVVVEPVNGAPWNAECLLRPDVDWFPIDSPGQHSGDAVNRLLVVVVAMRWSRQALRARDEELKGRDAARRVVPCEQEAHRERPETDGLVGRINAEVDGLHCHLVPLMVNLVYYVRL